MKRREFENKRNEQIKTTKQQWPYYYLGHTEMGFPQKSLFLLVQHKIWVFSQNTHLWRAFLACSYPRMHGFCGPVHDLNGVIPSWGSPWNQQFILHQNFMERSFWLDGVVAASHSGTVGVPAAFHLLVDLIVGYGNRLPVTICLVRSHSATNEFRTLPNILANSLL